MITDFVLLDLGLEEITAEPKKHPLGRFEHWAAGWGTDAESALDSMLHHMDSLDYNIAGLEHRIKNTWNPSTVEGDGLQMYHLILKFNGGRE